MDIEDSEQSTRIKEILDRAIYDIRRNHDFFVLNDYLDGTYDFVTKDGKCVTVKIAVKDRVE